MKWRIYYDDGQTFSSQAGDVADAPGWGVQVIVEPNAEVGRRLHSRADYYIYLGDRWAGVDFVGLIDYLVEVLGIVKVGRMTEGQVYRQILARARDDDDFPPKSAWLQDEHRR